MQIISGEVLILFQKPILISIINYLVFNVGLFSILLLLIVMYFMPDHLDSQTIALLILLFAVIIFSAVFIIALVKDKVQRRKTSQHTVFGS